MNLKILLISEGITNKSIAAQPWKHIIKLGGRIKEIGHEVEILTDLNRSSVSSYEEIEGLRVHKAKKGMFLFDSQELLKFIDLIDADIINWHGSDLWSSVHFWRIRNKLRKNIVWTLHSYPFSIADIKYLDLNSFFLLYRIWNNILNASLPSFLKKRLIDIPEMKFIIALSERLKDYLKKMNIKDEKIKVIRSGVDTDKFKPQNLITKQSMRFKDDDKIILYYGPISLFRGIDTLILTIPKIKKEVPSVKLLILARETPSYERRILERNVRNKKEISIIPGILKEDVLIKYLSVSDIVVFPFRFWPQVECPLTILEAMSMEKPIIATNTGAIPEIITHGENGILVPPGNPRLLAEYVIKLLKDKDLSTEIGKNARKTVKNFYDWDVIARQTLEVFRSTFI